MLLLIIFAFIAGIVTILSPCILPILPIVLSGSVTGGKKRPLGVVTGFIISFTFFTLFLTSIVRSTGVSANFLRNFSVVVVFLFGLSLIVPGFQKFTESLFAKLSKFMPKSSQRGGFLGGLLIGISIGLIWTPCVGPILGSVISLALTGEVSGAAAIIAFTYSLGTAIPMLAIVYGGRNLLNKAPWLLKNTAKIQKFFGILMILTAIAIYFNYDRAFQAYVLNKFPNYGAGLTSLEDNEAVNKELENLEDGDGFDEEDMGKPMLELIGDTAPTAPEIIPGGEWFNLSDGKESLTLSELRGKVVLIDFWTYSCINCIRTLPFLRDWHESYKESGLVIIGVHTPEFEFEKDPDNVSQAISDFELEYVVVQDNNYATWRAYKNRYWPAKYLIDKNGKIRYTHFGEGKYDETEEVIQELLKEAGYSADKEIDNPDYQITARTPELYLGYGRMAYYAKPLDIKAGQKATYTSPDTPGLHRFAFNGDWFVDSEYSRAYGGSSLILNFEAKDVFLVIRPVNKTGGKIRVYLDGEIVSDQAGEDVEGGIVTVDKDRLYELIKLDASGKHLLRLEFLDSNLEVYAFTFG